VGLVIHESEAAPYYFKYIGLVETDDIVGALQAQLDEILAFLNSIPDAKSLYRYAPEKWSLREVLSHINDGERLFLDRAFWFARGLPGPLPSFDQDKSVAASGADHISWSNHIDEFCAVRSSTLHFFRNLPSDAWSRTGIASDNPFTVRALAYIIAGHVTHHRNVIAEKYLGRPG
jgi:uncharacterized damage-inducible protein DinB